MVWWFACFAWFGGCLLSLAIFDGFVLACKLAWWLAIFAIFAIVGGLVVCFLVALLACSLVR